MSEEKQKSKKKKINLLPAADSFAATGYVNIIDDPSVAKNLGDVEFLVGDTFSISSENDSSVDEVIYNKELNFLGTDDLARFVQELNRIIAPSGKVVLFYTNTRLTIHNIDFDGALEIAEIWDILYNGRQTAIDHEFIANLLMACGFKVTNVLQVGAFINGKFKLEATRTASE